MMTRVFTFTPDAKGRIDFRLAYETFRSRDPQKIEKDDRRCLAELQRAFEAVSVPIGELPEDIDMRMRKLQDDGGTITISQRSHEKLATFAAETHFQAGLSVQVEDFLDRWSAAEKREADTSSAAEPPKRKLREAARG